jgi:hypothetical protein
LLLGDFRIAPRQNLKPIVVPFIERAGIQRHARRHHQWYKDIWRLSDLHAGKSLARDAHYGHLDIVDEQRLVENIWIAPKAPVPIAVAQDDVGFASRNAVVAQGEYAPHCGSDAENFKVVARNKLTAATLGLALRSDTCGKGRASQHAANRNAAVAKTLVHRVGKRFGVVAVAGEPPREGAGIVKHDKFAGIANWQAAQQHLVHQRKNCRVGANSECQRNHHNCREAGILRQHAQAVADVLPQTVHLGLHPHKTLQPIHMS